MRMKKYSVFLLLICLAISVPSCAKDTPFADPFVTPVHTEAGDESVSDAAADEKAMLSHPEETLVEVLTYRNVKFEVVERPDVIWVGCVDYADNNTDESDIGATLRRYQELADVEKYGLMNPGYDAALSINYTTDEKPCGIMFAVETYTAEQDERCDVFVQPGGLWMRVLNNYLAATLIGKDSAGTYELFGLLNEAALENGYIHDPNVLVEVEYSYNYSPEDKIWFAYIPVIGAE